MIDAVTEAHPFVAAILWELSALDDADLSFNDRADLAKRARSTYDRIAPSREFRMMDAVIIQKSLAGNQRIQEITDCVGRLYLARQELETRFDFRQQLATTLWQSGMSYFLYGASSQGVPKLLRALRFMRGNGTGRSDGTEVLAFSRSPSSNRRVRTAFRMRVSDDTGAMARRSAERAEERCRSGPPRAITQSPRICFRAVRLALQA